MKKDILDRIKWKEILVLLISLLSISYNSYAQSCSCTAANTFNITSGDANLHGKLTAAEKLIGAGEEICVVATGGGEVEISSSVQFDMEGGDLYFCSTDGTEIDITNVSFTESWGQQSGNVYLYTDIDRESSLTIYSIDYHNYGTFTSQDISITTNNAGTKTASITNYTGATVTSTGDIDLSSTNATITNHGTMTMVNHATSSGGVLINRSGASFTTTGDMYRLEGYTTNYGEFTVGGRLSLGGSGYTLDLTGGIFRVQNLTLSNGVFEADAGDCAVFYVTDETDVGCSATTTDGKNDVTIIDATYDQTNDRNLSKSYIDGTCGGASTQYLDYTDFDNASACAQVLPVHFVDVYLVENQLYWTTIREENNVKFVIESSLDGKTFEAIGEIKGAVNSNYDIQYVFEDIDQTSEKTYYRIKQIDIDGGFTYSKIVTSIQESNPIITLYPNPVSEDELNISIRNIEGNVSYEIISSIGDVVFSNEIEIEDHFFEETIDVLNYTSGLYFMKVQTSQETIIEQLVIE